MAFFHIAEGFESHTQTLGLFDQSLGTGYRGIDSAMTTLNHLAFEISLADYENEKRRLEQKGVKVFPREAG